MMVFELKFILDYEDNYLFIHSLILFIYSFKQSLIQTIINSFIYSCIHLFFNSLIFINLFIACI